MQVLNSKKNETITKFPIIQVRCLCYLRRRKRRKRSRAPSFCEGSWDGKSWEAVNTKQLHYWQKIGRNNALEAAQNLIIEIDRTSPNKFLILGILAMGSTERKQSALYAGRPIPLGDRKLTFFQEKPTDPRASTRRMKSFTTEMVEYTKPPHLRTQRFEGPKPSIFGPNVNDSTDQEDLANLDLTRSRSASMQVTHERTLSQNLRNSCILRVPTKPEERDVVDVIKERLGKIRKPYEPPELSEGLADVLIMYKTSKDDDTRLLLRAHSRVLMRHCDAFVELLESGMREMSLREYLDRQFMRSRKFGRVHHNSTQMSNCDDIKSTSWPKAKYKSAEAW